MRVGFRGGVLLLSVIRDKAAYLPCKRQPKVQFSTNCNNFYFNFSSEDALVKEIICIFAVIMMRCLMIEDAMIRNFGIN